MTTTIMLVRHAAHSLQGRSLVGRAPGVSLSFEGQRQAEMLALALAGQDIAALYTSPLDRARETAAVIGRLLNMDAAVLEEVNELDFGRWSGCDLNDLTSDDLWQRFNTVRSLTRPPGGETVLEAQTRMVQAIERLQQNHPDQTIVVVSHGEPIKCALAYYMGLSLDGLMRFEVDTGSISTISIGPYGTRVLGLNVTVMPTLADTFASAWETRTG